MTYSFTTPQPVAPLIVGSGKGKPGPKTVMIAGLPRGGTSATAAVVDALGVPVGNSHDGHCEFPEFKADPFTHKSSSAMMAIMARMDHDFDNWGLQVWHQLAPITAIGHNLRNPHLILVFRDLAALVQRHLQTGEYGDTPREVMGAIHEQQSHLWHVARNGRFPTLLVSFERLRTTPDIVVLHIAEFLGLEPTAEMLADAAARVNKQGGYIKQQSEHEYPEVKGESGE